MEPQKAPTDQPSNSAAPNLDQDVGPLGAPPQSTVPVPGFAGSTPKSTDSGMPAESMAGTTFRPESAAPHSMTPNFGAAPSPPSAPSFAPPEQSAQATDSGSPFPVTTDVPADPLPLTKPKGRKKGLFIGLIIAAVVLLLSGGAAAAYYYVSNKPENVLKRALANTLDKEKNKTVEYSGSLAVKDSGSGMELEGTYSGVLDNQTGAFDLTSQIDVVLTNLTFDLRSTDGKTYYVKVGGLEGLAGLLTTSGMYSPEEAGLVGLYGPLITAINDQWLEINQSVISQFTDDSFKNEKLSDADRQKLLEAYKNNLFVIIKEVLPDEEVKGAQSHHYRLGLDKAKLKALAAALKTANLDSLKITQDQLDAFNKTVDDANFDSYPLEVWIDKDSKMLKQIELRASEDDAEMRFRLTIDSYNKPVKVEKPEDAKSILEIMGDFFGGDSLDPNIFIPSSTDDPQDGISL